MPLATYDMVKNKEMIMRFISARGPCLPIHIAHDLKTDTIFASAFLSELYNEGKLKMTHMKVGSTSLYYSAGQEAQLENFTQYLNAKEKEAFFLLKKEKILKDESLEPAIRVAMNSIKDFALPFTDSSTNLKFWRYFLHSKEDTIKSFEEKEQTNKPAEPIIKKTETPKTEEKRERKEKKKEPEKAELILSLDISEKEPEKSKEKEIVSPFIDLIKSHLEKKGIRIIKETLVKKKEYNALVSINSEFGEQEYHLTAKDKKKLKEEDLTEALKQAHEQRMPALILSQGEIDKKALPFFEKWKNLIKFDKIS